MIMEFRLYSDDGEVLYLKREDAFKDVFFEIWPYTLLGSDAKYVLNGWHYHPVVCKMPVEAYSDDPVAPVG